jgi:ABC-type Na+ efflux pump permease subunit
LRSALRRRLVVARRDLASLSREKTIVLALLIQLFVATFSSFLVVGLAAFYDPGTVSGNPVEAAVTGDAADELLAASADQRGLRATRYDDATAARRDFRQGFVDAVLDVEYGDDGRIRVDATASSGLRTTLVVVQVREALERLERAERAERTAYLERAPLELPPDVDASPYFGFAYTILLPLLIFLPVFISGSTAVDVLTEEIERGTLDLLRVTPASLVAIVDGKALGMAVLAPLQGGLWMALLSLNGIPIANPLALVVVTTALAVLLVAVGTFTGLAVAERRRAQLLYSVGILVVFGAAALLPEHPATTVALLAIDSATATTYLSVAGYAVGAVALAALVRAYAARLDPDGL